MWQNIDLFIIFQTQSERQRKWPKNAKKVFTSGACIKTNKQKTMVIKNKVAFLHIWWLSLFGNLKLYFKNKI